MSDLTSCYFCGTALDAPVERYPLTPPSIDATTGRSVALCPTCRRKLVTVLEIVGEEFDAVADDAATEPETADADTADETAEADDETPATGSAATAGARATDDEHEGETPSVSSDGESADPAADEDHEEAADEVETGASDDAIDAGDPVPAAGTGAEPLAESGSDDVTDGSAGEDEVAADSAETDVPTDDGAGDEPTDDGADVDDGHAELLSTPAAQKVIKLLQNREFPLEREEFEIVASNAYDIPMRDCEEVLDTLVAEGYVGEDGAMLTRPA